MWLTSTNDLLLLISFGSALMDIRNGKVDNQWLALCALCGLGIRWNLDGPRGMARGLAAMAVPLLLLGWLFIFRMMGAGDIKLLCALGAFLDPACSLALVFGSLLMGGAISLCILMRSGVFRQRIYYLSSYITTVLQTGEIRPYIQKGVHREENLPFTVPVLLCITVLVSGGIPR